MCERPSYSSRFVYISLVHSEESLFPMLFKSILFYNEGSPRWVFIATDEFFVEVALCKFSFMLFYYVMLCYTKLYSDFEWVCF